MAVSVKQFTKQLVDCGLMSADAIVGVVDALPDDKKPQDGEQLARLLVRQKKLTAYQAQQIYAGKGKSLILGNYLILDKLGQGGMGLVLRAEHRRMDRTVALKVLSPKVTKTPEVLQRFQREVKAAAKLTHPNIVIAHDADEAGGTHFLVMEYVKGSDLSSLVKEHGPLPLEQALDCILQAARGLAYAHERGVVHRDIKPANLLLDEQGTIKILDMGLARLETAGEQQDQLTGTGQIMGTVDFMAPEQAVNTKHADARADIYSLGVTLWYLLTGRRLFEGETVVEKLMAHQTQPIPSLRAACPQATLALEAIFAKAIAKSPQTRYQSMSELVADLERCRSEAQQDAHVAAGDVAAMEVDRAGPPHRAGLGTGPTPAFPETQISKAPPISSPSAKHDETLKSSAPLVETDPNTERSLPFAPIAMATLIGSGRRWWQDRRVRIALGSGALLLLVLGVWIIVRDKDAREVARVEVPKGGSATVEMAAENGDAKRSSGKVPVGPPPLAIAPFDAAKAKELQEAWAKHLGVPVEITNSIGMKLVLIPPGEFVMGSSPEEREWAMTHTAALGATWAKASIDAERPQHEVNITAPFYIGAFPVTQDEYAKVMGINPSAFSPKQIDGLAFELPPSAAEEETKCRTDFRASAAGVDTSRHPVESVNWDEAVEFCRRLSAMPAERAAGRLHQLPTEAQWEYACRAGTTTRWSFGDNEAELRKFAWYKESCGDHTRPVGQKKPNAWGLFDMHGNVYQWCVDWYGEDYYRQSPRDDPAGPKEGGIHSRRGSYWYDIACECRSAHRALGVSPRGRTCMIGFRVVMQTAAGRMGKDRPSPASEDLKPKADKGTTEARPSSSVATVPSPAIAPFDAKKAKEHQAAWAKYLGVPVEMTNSIGMKFVLIPPGEFDMGSTDEEIARASEEGKKSNQPEFYFTNLRAESPRHRVRITKPFYLGVCPVTQAEYATLMGVNPSACTASPIDASALESPPYHLSPTGKEDDRAHVLHQRQIAAKLLAGRDTSRHPVETVACDDCEEFCRRLSALPAEDAEGRVYRLPTEAEWEYACRAGTTTLRFFGDDPARLFAYAWYFENSGTVSHPVGQRDANPWQLYDMLGNVMQWCSDSAAPDPAFQSPIGYYYKQSPRDDPQGPDFAGIAKMRLHRMQRGGTFFSRECGCRSAYRHSSLPTARCTTAGFRVAVGIAAKP